MDAHKTPDAVREAVIAAITKADANFGYSYCLTKMDEAGEEHTLFMDGFEPAVFQDREDGYPVIEQRRNAARTDAILAALDSRAGDAGEEIENGYTADDAVDFVFNRLASKLGLVDWQVVEGSEEWEGDVSATLHRLLIDAGIIDDETGAVATLATPAPAVDAVPAGEVERLVKQLSDEAGDWRHNTYTRVMLAQMRDRLSASLSHGEGRK
jgi:hypothetical protein